MIADLDTLLTALYVELTDRIIPSRGLARRGPGKPPEVTDAKLVCLAVAQVLLRYDDERHWVRAAARQVGYLFPRPSQSSPMRSGPAGWPATGAFPAELDLHISADPGRAARMLAVVSALALG